MKPNFKVYEKEQEKELNKKLERIKDRISAIEKQIELIWEKLKKW